MGRGNRASGLAVCGMRRGGGKDGLIKPSMEIPNYPLSFKWIEVNGKSIDNGTNWKMNFPPRNEPT